MDQETVKISALAAIFDLLHFFGLEAFKLETALDDKTVVAETSVKDADSSDQQYDFDDLHSESSSQPPRQQDATDIGANILTILADLLDSNVSHRRPTPVCCSRSRCLGNTQRTGENPAVAAIHLDMEDY